jgi:hypothetical protein
MTRRKLLAAAQAYSKDKVLPDDVNKPKVFNGQRSGEMIIPEDADWLQEYKDICKKCVNTETVKVSE